VAASPIGLSEITSPSPESLDDFRLTLGRLTNSVFGLSVPSNGVVKDQKYDRANCRHEYAVQIQSRHTDVAEKMEDPSADDRAYYA
jgi:hypothetical protein